ncbi:permease [Rufibacter sp. DG15C]|uniref:LptF/LptG family permease n=1 Tax=Rufibacter sp. DG15C TaxID=1379909 RepID=UPI00078EEC45|nr:LptF/LptG family permease [Rufibacter sp. DG15C]AMM50336.1 permease [Rufibacter sp. DG15C]
MKLLDKYILKKFLTTFVFVVIILMAVICVIDFVEKNDDFIQNNLSARTIIFDYYINMIPFYANLLSPITVFIATVFVTAKLASHTEIVAILSSGVSFKRMLVPYIIGSVVIGIFIFFFSAYVIPNANKTRVAFEIKYVKNPYTYEGRNVHFRIGPETYAYLESYNNHANVGYKFTLETIKKQELVRKLASESIRWDSTKQKWHMDAYTLRTFNGDKETVTTGGPVDTTLNMLPKDFASTYRMRETLTMAELDDVIKEKQMRGATDIAEFMTEKYERYSYPFAITVLTVIGVILSSRKVRGGVGFQIALGFILAFIFIIFVMMSRSLAQVGGIPPQLAAWIPLAVFSVIGVVLYKTVPR